MLRVLGYVELLLSILALSLALWPVSGLCVDRVYGFDCESWFIFGVNIFAPVGLILLLCSLLTLKLNSLAPQYALASGSLIVMGYWLAHAV